MEEFHFMEIKKFHDDRFMRFMQSPSTSTNKPIEYTKSDKKPFGLKDLTEPHWLLVIRFY